jgi:hypothetical protein
VPTAEICFPRLLTSSANPSWRLPGLVSWSQELAPRFDGVAVSGAGAAHGAAWLPVLIDDSIPKRITACRRRALVC